jgi:DNA polymerase alpha-associated DNA helicase A
MNVILSTCAGAGENYLSKFKSDENPFDYVIIDECAQGTEILCWIPILMGKKIILAGDHLQLPPTIKNKTIEKKLSFTLFDRLMKLYKDFSVMLNVQYRMNEKIMKFSSNELYNGKLIADESVKNHTINDLINNNEITKNDNFNIINESLILIDTSNYNFHETLDPETLSKCNFGEVEICKIITDYLINKLKISSIDIGIITPYSAQVLTLSNSLNQENYPGLEISTVDGFQGREKEIIILSLVRSNEKNEVGFLADKRRLNVAITRAKRMLIFIGNVDTVSNEKNDEGFLNNLCGYMEKNAIKIDLFEIFGEICDDDDYNPQEKIQKVREKCVPEMEEEKMISESRKNNEKRKNKKNNNENKDDNDKNENENENDNENNDDDDNKKEEKKKKKFRRKKKNK